MHGSNASLHTWEPWVQRLGDEFRIITLDLPGHGLTGRVPGDDYSSTAFVETINAVVEHLGVNTFALGVILWAGVRPGDTRLLILKK